MTGLRVLIVDDSDVYRAALESFVTAQPGMEVVGCASGGSSGVELAALLAPDVILMDLCMPDMDGFRAMRAVMRADARARVIALSAHRWPDTAQHVLECGGAAFVDKADASRSLIDQIRLTAPASSRDRRTRDDSSARASPAASGGCGKGAPSGV